MAEQTGQEKTQPATGRKRQKARREGQVAKSKEINSALLLAGALGMFFFAGGSWLNSLVEAYGNGLDLARFWDRQSGMAGLYDRWVGVALELTAPFFVLFVLLAIGGNLGQVGFLVTSQVLHPKWNRLNPVGGFKRLFSINGTVELVKSILKLLVVGWIAFRTLKPEMLTLAGLGERSLNNALAYSAALAFRLVFRVWLAMAVLAVLDLIYVRWKYGRDLRMTKQEVKEEHRESEGDPRVKARVRSLQVRMARQRMMQEVPKADVVIANPDHFAVALRYDKARDMAPIVVALGAGLLCARIKEIAREHGVPVVENPPLARFLYRNVKLGQAIPVTVYRVVAEILAHVYRIRGRLSHGSVNG